jgi:hypothetical protein
MIMKKPKLVTRESLRELVAKDAAKVVARALIVIYERQTSEEQSQAVTKVRNGVGFSGADAEVGTRCAVAALAGKLEPWMLKIWSSVTSTGFPKICKYARQLNEIAEQKANMQRLTTPKTALLFADDKERHTIIADYHRNEVAIMDFYGAPVLPIDARDRATFN